jgi:two-component system sensor histidine kinase KdpD
VTWVALVPVSVDGAVVGVLSVTTADEHPFTEPEIRRLEAVGNLGGLALANLERMETLETMAGQARALERSKSHFLNLASHEMRGPLAVVSGYLEMIADGDLGVVDDRIRDRILPLVRSKVGELTDIVERMLTTARLEEDTTDLVTGDVDVSAAVEELVGPGGALVEEGFERLELRLPETRPVARADRASVATIVSNLVDNACKFSPPGSPVVVTVVDAGADVLVSVTDRGPGIQPHHVDRLFTRFGRIITRENSHVRGTGLGLWLCRELARRQGGDVTFETQPGRGSTFTLRLPRSTRDLELEGRRDNAVVAAKATM